MAIDLITTILLALAFIQGYRKGFLVALCSMLGYVVGLVCALKLAHTLSAWLVIEGFASSGWSLMISYALLFVGVSWIVRWLGKALSDVARMAMLGWANGIMGGVIYCLLAMTAWSSLLWIAHRMHLIAPETIAYAKTYDLVAPIAPAMFQVTGFLLPFAKNVFTEVSTLFDHINQQGATHVGTH